MAEYTRTAGQLWKASCIIAENMMMKSVGANSQPCFTPFVTQKGIDITPLVLTLAMDVNVSKPGEITQTGVKTIEIYAHT